MSVLDNVTLAPRKVLRPVRGQPRPRRPLACSTGSAWPTRRASSPTGCPAVSSSGSRSSGPSRCSPTCMLLDEVTSALDPELVAEVLEVIRELAARA